MTTRIVTLVLSGLLGLTPIAAHAQYDAEWTDEGAGAAPAAPDSSTAAPAEQPPAPPALNSDAWGQDQATPSVPAGQWVYTQQYGWIWMPYGDAYAYVPPAGYGSPYAYVYYPVTSCWTWIAAPWIWGIGPWPFFGAIGPARFAWYGHGWWRTPSRWHYAPAFRGGYYTGRPVPGHRGGIAPRPAPYGGRARAYGSRAFAGSRGGYAARPVPYGGGFRGAGPAPSYRAFAGGGRGGAYASPRGSAGRGGSWVAGPRPGGGGGGGGRGRGYGGGRGHR